VTPVANVTSEVPTRPLVACRGNPLFSEGDSPRSIMHIEAAAGWTSLGLRELWEYRELLCFLTWRDVKVRYKQTALGVAWAFLQPFITMLLFSIFFGRLAKIPSDGVPYALFSYTALVPWMFFANGLTQASNSLVGNGRLITKVFFPRLTIPIAAVMAALVDFLLTFATLLGMAVYYGVTPTVYRLLYVPAFLALAVVTALGVGFWFSALNVQYRDVQYALPFVAQCWMLATPIAYPSRLVPEPWRTVYAINPMVGVVEGFRWALLQTGPSPGPMLIVSTVAAACVLISGAFYFRRMEKSFADVI
jgi:lipopolysaccharide transport system permease protein